MRRRPAPPGPGVGVRVGDDHAVDEFGPGGQHACVVGRVDGLGEVTPAGQRGDAVLAEEFDRGQDVRAGRQEPAIAERAEDPGVVGGGRTQLEQLPLGGGDGVVEQVAQVVGEAVEFVGGEPLLPVGRRHDRLAVRAVAGLRDARAGLRGQAEQFRQPLLPRQGPGGATLGLVRPLRRCRRIGRAGGGQFGAALAGSGFAGVLRGPAGRLAGRVPGCDGGLLGVAGGQGRPGRVGVGRGVVEPAGPHRLGGLLLDLGEALLEVTDLAAGALRLRGGGGGVAVGRVADLLEGGGALLLLVGVALRLLRGRVQGPYEVDGGLGARGQCRGGVPLGLLDRGGHAGDAVGGGAVAQHGLGGLPRRVQRAGVGELALLRGGGLLGPGERERGVPVGEFGGDQRTALAGRLGVCDGVRGGGDALGQVGGPDPLPHTARGEPAGQGPGAALGSGVDVTRAGAGLRGLHDPAEEVDGAGGEVAFGDQLGAPAQLVAEAADQVGEPVGVAGVGDGAQQQVGEVGVLLDREETGGLTFVGVHLALVAEEFGVEAEVAEVLDPAVVDLLPVHLQVRVRLARLREGVPEALHGAAPPARTGLALDRGPYGGGLRHGEAVEAQSRPRAEGVPGLGELPRVVGDLPPAPLADLSDDDALAGQHVLPLQRDVSAVVGEQELAQHAGAGAAERVAVTRQHHGEDQLEQHRLAAAVLQEEHARGGGPARRADRLLLEELRLGGRGVGHDLAHTAQVKHGVGVARTGGPDRVEADPGQLVHGGLS